MMKKSKLRNIIRGSIKELMTDKGDDLEPTDIDQVGLLGFACGGASCYGPVQGGQFSTLSLCKAECPYPGSARPAEMGESEIKRMQELAKISKK
jgi:hypothetical protein